MLTFRGFLFYDKGSKTYKGPGNLFFVVRYVGTVGRGERRVSRLCCSKQVQWPSSSCSCSPKRDMYVVCFFQSSKEQQTFIYPFQIKMKVIINDEFAQLWVTLFCFLTVDVDGDHGLALNVWTLECLYLHSVSDSARFQLLAIYWSQGMCMVSSLSH